jgi:DNA-binding response OmpR family regulator
MRKRVLVIDSDVQTTSNITMAFNIYLLNWTVVTSNSYSRCLSEIKKSKPDFIILGNVSDSPNIKAVKGIRSISKAHLMVITTRNEKSFLANVLSSGADGYMTKPPNYFELIARVKRVYKQNSVVIHGRYSAKVKQPRKIASF